MDSKKNRMSEPATENQLKWLKANGWYTEAVSYTKGMVCDIIGSTSCNQKQLDEIKKHGFDISKGVTVTQAFLALKMIAEIKKVLKER